MFTLYPTPTVFIRLENRSVPITWAFQFVANTAAGFQKGGQEGLARTEAANGNANAFMVLDIQLLEENGHGWRDTDLFIPWMPPPNADFFTQTWLQVAQAEARIKSRADGPESDPKSVIQARTIHGRKLGSFLDFTVPNEPCVSVADNPLGAWFY